MGKNKVRELYIEQRFISKILDTIDALIIVLDVEGRLIHHNAACERLTGINFTKMTKFPIWDYLIPSDEVEYVKNVVAKLGNGEKRVEAENHWITKTGETRLIKWSSVSTVDGNGRVEYIVSSGIDITEQRRMDVELRQSEKRYRKLYETIPQGILYLNHEGKIISANPAAERMMGIFDGKRNCHSFLTPLYHLIWEDGRELTPSEHPTYVAYQTGTEINNVIVGYTCDNEEIRWLKIHAIPLFKKEDETPYQVYAIIDDVTEQKVAREEFARLDRLDLIGQMGAGIGHEVRNPMTTVKGFLQFLGEKSEYARDKEYFELMIDEIDRANSIITEFLSIAVTKSATLAICNLNDIIKRIYPLLGAHAYNMNREVVVEASPVPDLLLNQREIHQLILNLVRNGLEAIEEGGKVYIKTYTRRSEVILEVQDNGQGIDPVVLKRIGTPFLTTKPQGTGLGLAICYGIAARHDAKIDIHTSSEGTRFLIKFKKMKKKDIAKEGRPV